MYWCIMDFDHSYWLGYFDEPIRVLKTSFTYVTYFLDRIQSDQMLNLKVAQIFPKFA